MRAVGRCKMCDWPEQPLALVEKQICCACYQWWRYHSLREHGKDYFTNYQANHQRALDRVNHSRATKKILSLPPEKDNGR